MGRRTPKSPPRQPFANSARISNSVHLSDLRFGFYSHGTPT